MAGFDLPADFIARYQALEQKVQDLAVLVSKLSGQIGDTHIRAGGAETATWPGGGAASGNVTIAHGLGVVPTSADAFSRDVLFEYNVVSRDATNIVVSGYITTNTVVSASSRTFDWIALA